MRRWCKARGRSEGALLSLDQLWRLAQPWYGDRLDPNWQPRSIERSQAILESAGLTGEFWQLAH